MKNGLTCTRKHCLSFQLLQPQMMSFQATNTCSWSMLRNVCDIWTCIVLLRAPCDWGFRNDKQQAQWVCWSLEYCTCNLMILELWAVPKTHEHAKALTVELEFSIETYVLEEPWTLDGWAELVVWRKANLYHVMQTCHLHRVSILNSLMLSQAVSVNKRYKI